MVTFVNSNNRIHPSDFSRHTELSVFVFVYDSAFYRPLRGEGAQSRLLQTMSTEYNPQQYQLNPNQTDYTTDPPWADLELTVPNDRSAIDVGGTRENVFIYGHSTV